MVFLEVSVFSGIHNIAGENLSRFMDLARHFEFSQLFRKCSKFLFIQSADYKTLFFQPRILQFTLNLSPKARILWLEEPFCFITQKRAAKIFISYRNFIQQVSL